MLFYLISLTEHLDQYINLELVKHNCKFALPSNREQPRQQCVCFHKTPTYFIRHHILTNDSSCKEFDFSIFLVVLENANVI